MASIRKTKINKGHFPARYNHIPRLQIIVDNTPCMNIHYVTLESQSASDVLILWEWEKTWN